MRHPLVYEQVFIYAMSVVISYAALPLIPACYSVSLRSLALAYDVVVRSKFCSLLRRLLFRRSSVAS